jgi:steroid delta-isomerase-like uncharacterized protein
VAATSLARSFVEVCVNADEVARLADFVAADVVVHAATPGGPPDTRGLPELTDVFRRVHAVFPDLYVTVEDVFGSGDRVAVRWTARGTHDAEWAGFPATGLRVTFGGIDIYRIEDGKIKEWWRNEDFAYLLQQLAGDFGRVVG